MRENRIEFDPRLYTKGASYSFNFEFTDEEKNYVKQFSSFLDTEIDVNISSYGDIYHIELSIDGPIELLDFHTAKTITYEINDSVEVIVNLENPEESDIEVDEDGIYDLRGCVLALLYNAIPKNYSESELSVYSSDNYVVMSEEEYKKQKKSNSPFDELDETDYE